MCGIVGYIGEKNAKNIILSGLSRLEYRGYDSAGVAFLDREDGITIFKEKGMLCDLVAEIPERKETQAIGHTRWATHGKPNKENAHPFYDCKGEIALLHNGIIENYMQLKEKLLEEGHKFTSKTDTEVLVHLVEKHFKGNLEEAVRAMVKDVTGSFAVVVLHKNDPDKIVAARNESPLILGRGAGENFIGSDVAAFLEITNKAIYLMDKEIAIVTRDDIEIQTLEGERVEREEKLIDWKVEDAEKGGFEHFMLKEIFEQPTAIHNSLRGRIPDLEANGFGAHDFTTVKIIACGTSYHAGLVGKHIIERLLKIPTTVEMASEYRYSEPIHESPLVITISQSGETADSLAATRVANRRGYKTIAVTNVVGSSLTREADYTMYTRAGPEVGVAATKTFTTQLVALYIIAITLGLIKHRIDYDKIRYLTDSLRQIPRYVQSVLDNAAAIKEAAKFIGNARDVFFIGRNINYPTALEGALKLKEISYIHAEGYPAGELKHGPLALITEETPVVAIAVGDQTYEKMLGNIGEMSARGSPMIAIGYEDDKDLEKFADVVIRVPKVPDIFSPITISVALQLLSYYVAKDRDCSIDKPRNLAKSVTVE